MLKKNKIKFALETYPYRLWISLSLKSLCSTTIRIVDHNSL